MNTETTIRLKQRAFLLRESFSASSYIELLQIAAESPELLNCLPSPTEIVPKSVSFEESELNDLCGLIRRCRVARPDREENTPPSREADDSSTRLPEHKKELVSQIVEAFNVQIQTCDLCKRDGRLWPFVDAYALDAPIRSVFEGSNPFEHLAEVLRTYFASSTTQAPLTCAEALLDHLDALLNAWTPETSAGVCNRTLLLKTTSAMRGGDCLDVEAMIGFIGSTTVVANTYLAHCPDLEEKPATLRLFLLLFDIGRKGTTLVPRAPKGQRETITHRISRVLGRAGSKPMSLAIPDQVQSVIEDIGYVPKVIEVEHIERLMPRPLDGDHAGEEFYKRVAENLGLIVSALSAQWPGSVESLYHLTTSMQGQYDQELYDRDPTVGLEAGMMSAGMSIAGPETLLSEERSEFGLKVAGLLIEDGWTRASDDFVGYLLLLYSFFPSELSATERRLFSKHFGSRAAALRSRVVSTALAQLAADESSSANRLWASQYTHQPAAEQIRLVRSREESASRSDLERTLATDVGGPEFWTRLQRRTRELLVEAETRWSAECREIGRMAEWGATAGAFFMPLEHELKHWFSILSEEPIRSVCISRGVRLEKGHLTAGPIIVAIRKLPELPNVVREAVQARGLDVERLVPLMKRMGDTLHLRNQAFHADEFGVDKLIKMRQALFSGGLLRSFAECLPASAP